MAKSRGLFPGPRSVPKRRFASAAGNSEYKHVLPNTDNYQIGMTGWKAGRSAGGVSGRNRLTGSPTFNDGTITGDGGFAYDPSLKSILGDKGKLDADSTAVNKKLSRD